MDVTAPERLVHAPCTALALAPEQRDGGADDNTAPGAARAPTIADIWPHGLTAQGRETRACALHSGATLADLVAQEWPGSAADIAASVDGRPVARAAWAGTPLQGGEIVTLRALVHGGGDKDPLRIVLQLAVLVAAVVVPPLLFASTWAQALAGAAITVAGGLVVNALFPIVPGDGTRPVEPVYSLTGGANRARPYQPLLLVMGAHRVFPDLAASAYTEIVDYDHFLHQIFHFGLGDLALADFRIGDTPIGAFEEVSYDFGNAQGHILFVYGNVDSEAGAALEDTAFVERSTAAGTRRLGIDIAGRLFRVNDEGDIQSNSAEIEIEWEPADGSGPVERRTLTLTHDSQQPYRRSLAYDLGSAGAWAVRVRRTADPSAAERVFDDLSWTALRAYQIDTGDYFGQTRLGLSIRASGQLSGRLDRFSAMVQQRVPTWDGVQWTQPMPSSNPAWIFRWYARGLYIRGRLVAGIGLPDARIDEASIRAWGAWCEAQGLACNMVLDRSVSHADVLALIGQCGRASPSWQTGKLGVVWDEGGRPATALITPGNIVAGSFAVEYASGQAAQEVAVRYIEPALDWQYNTLRRLVPGVQGTPARSATVTLQGVTSAEQAAVACNLQAARQLYHRRRFSWEMAAEGLSLTRGDVVHLTHSLIDGGQAGRLAGGTAASVILDRPVDPGPGGALMLFRLPSGGVHQSAVTAPAGTVGETATLELATPLPEPPDAHEASPLDTLWRLYDASLPPVRARIVAVEPATDRRVRFAAIDEVEAYYDAATADLSAPLPALIRRAPRVLGITFAEALVRVGAGFAVEIEVALTTAGDWRGGVVRASVDDAPLRTVRPPGRRRDRRALAGATRRHAQRDRDARHRGRARGPALHRRLSHHRHPRAARRADQLPDRRARRRHPALALDPAGGDGPRRRADPPCRKRGGRHSRLGGYDALAPGPPHRVAAGDGRAAARHMGLRRARDRYRRQAFAGGRAYRRHARPPAPRRRPALALPRRRRLAGHDERRRALRRRPRRAGGAWRL